MLKKIKTNSKANLSVLIIQYLGLNFFLFVQLNSNRRLGSGLLRCLGEVEPVIGNFSGLVSASPRDARNHVCTLGLARSFCLRTERAAIDRKQLLLFQKWAKQTFCGWTFSTGAMISRING